MKREALRSNKIILGIFVLVIGLLAGLAIGANTFSQNLPYHELQQVTTDSSGTTSVDAAGSTAGSPPNGVADTADSLGGCVRLYDSTTAVPLIIGGANLYYLNLPAFCYKGSCFLVFEMQGATQINDVISYVQQGPKFRTTPWAVPAGITPLITGGASTGANCNPPQNNIATLGGSMTLADDYPANPIPSCGTDLVLIGTPAQPFTLDACP